MDIKALSEKMSEFPLAPVEDIDAERRPKSVGARGLLVAVELRTWLRDGCGIRLSTVEVLEAKSSRVLAESLAGKLVEKSSVWRVELSLQGRHGYFVFYSYSPSCLQQGCIEKNQLPDSHLRWLDV